VAMIAGWQLQTLAQASVPRIMDSLAVGVVIALFAGLMARLSSRQSSSTKFVLWFGALLGVAAAPVFGVLACSVSPASIHAATKAAIVLPGSFANYIFAGWAIVATFLLAKIAVGGYRLFRLRQSFIPIDLSQLDARVAETLKRCQSQRMFSLCTSENIEVPAAVGLIEPVVVLPKWLMQELSPEELEQILLHEFAHLHRRDDWTNLIQQLVKALFFFHPAVWWIEKKVSLEREMACDDAVLAEAASPRSYAQCLHHLAEKTLARRSLAFMQAALGRVHHSSMRVAQILDGGQPRGEARPWRIALPLGGVAIACSLFAAKEPQLIAFQNSPSAQEAAAIVPYPAVPVRLASFKTGDEATLNSLTLQSVPSRGSRSRKRLTRNVIRPQFAPSRPSAVASNFNGSPRLVRYAKASTSMGSNAVLIVIEDFSSNNLGNGVYEIQVWHLTVWHPAVPSVSNEIPRKEI
jgi:beta-lactamase regulating signal transducer with metallopeptidase domain